MKRAPANVEPKIRSLGFDLKAFERNGKVPTIDTIAKKKIMKRTFNIEVTADYSMVSMSIVFLNVKFL